MISKQATKDVKELRQEMKKPDPDGDKIFELLCGTKYNKPLYGNNNALQK